MRRKHFEFEYSHVFNRGVRRLGIFREDEEYLQFLNLLRWSSEESGAGICAYCLMPNHFHLILCGSSTQIGKCMQRVESNYSRWYNERHGHPGTNFEGPYKCFPQRSSYFLSQRLSYIHMNPVAAKLAVDPAAYRWSSFRCYSNQGRSPLDVNPNPVLQRIGLSFDEVLAEYHPPQKTYDEPPQVQVCLEQVEWLQVQAEVRGDIWPLTREDLVIYWSRRAGIRPDVVAIALGTSPKAISNRTYKIGQHVEDHPGLLALIQPPK